MYSAKINGEATTFGTSGLLYRSNKVMYDRLTNSLWNQFTGEPIIGPLWESGVRLDFFPSLVTTWEEWVEIHPDTTVLDIETGLYPASLYKSEENRESIYYDYFNDPDTMFPVPDRDGRLATKEVVLGVQVSGGYKAYPVAALQEERVVNDVVGGEGVVVLGSGASQGARAYLRGDRVFEAVEGVGMGIPSALVDEEGVTWRVTEGFLVNASDESERLARIATHTSFWFGWFQFYGDTEVYGGR